MNPVAVLLAIWVAFHAGQFCMWFANRGKQAEIDRLWDHIHLAGEPALRDRELAVRLAHQAHRERLDPARLP